MNVSATLKCGKEAEDMEELSHSLWSVPWQPLKKIV